MIVNHWTNSAIFPSTLFNCCLCSMDWFKGQSTGKHVLVYHQIYPPVIWHSYGKLPIKHGDFPVHKLLNNRLGFPGFLHFFPLVSTNKNPMPSCIQTIWMISGSRNIPRSVELDGPCAHWMGHGSPIWKQWFSIAMLNYNQKTYLYIFDGHLFVYSMLFQLL